MPRQSTGKRLRFEVFKRDHFTCQYCGAQPPEVVLVVDHVTAVAAGGETSIDNLVAACEPCNQGKTDKPLSAVGIRPDADLLYLATQQEIAELRRYQAAMAEREVVLKELGEALFERWCETSGLSWGPDEGLIRELLLRYSPDVASDALMDLAVKMGSGYVRRTWRWVGYLHTVAKNLARERYGNGEVEAE